MEKVEIKVPDTVRYVKLVSGMVPGGMTKTEMQIVVLSLDYMKQESVDTFTSNIRKKLKYAFGFTSQELNNYMHKLRKKKVIKGTRYSSGFTRIFSNNIYLSIKFENGK